MPSVLRGGSWSTAVLAAGQGTSSNLEPRVYRIKYVVVQVYGFNYQVTLTGRERGDGPTSIPVQSMGICSLV
jgi:hypothetical protein